MSQPDLQGKFQDSLGYTKAVSKNKQTNTKSSKINNNNKKKKRKLKSSIDIGDSGELIQMPSVQMLCKV